MPHSTSLDTSLEAGRAVLRQESIAVAALAERLDDSFIQAVQLLLDCRGRAVVTGLGKTGAIGRKLAATLASTGTPALFLHAAEALHGDLGMVAPGDVLLALSYSGRGDEILSMLPPVRALGVPIIAITGATGSALALGADLVLDVSVEREACPLNLAPTCSTTAALALGDALAVATMEARGFATHDFARLHPGGAIGRGITRTVGDLMRTGSRLAIAPQESTMRAALEAISRAGAGAVLLTDVSGQLTGYLTDGDVRRALLSCNDAEALLRSPVEPMMTHSPLTLRPEMTALDAQRTLQERRFNDAPVVDDDNRPAGWLDGSDLLRAGVM